MERALEEDAASNGARVLKLHYPLCNVDLHALVYCLSAKPT
jgi:hypothetical protein